MKTEDYLKMYEDKPLIEKITAFGESIERMNNAEVHSFETRWHGGDKKAADYYSNEAEAQRDRVNGLYQMIAREIENLAGEKR